MNRYKMSTDIIHCLPLHFIPFQFQIQSNSDPNPNPIPIQSKSNLFQIQFIPNSGDIPGPTYSHPFPLLFEVFHVGLNK